MVTGVMVERQPRRRGAVILLVAVAFIMMMAMVALALDLGWVYCQEARFKRALDAAATSAATQRLLGRDAAAARQAARTFGARNGVSLADDDVSIDPMGNNSGLVRVRKRITIPLFFAGVIGSSGVPVGYEVYALANQDQTVLYRSPLAPDMSSGLVPLGVPHADLTGVLRGSVDSPAELAGRIFASGSRWQPGQKVMLKAGSRFHANLGDIVSSGGSDQGALDLAGPGSGANKFRSYFKFGYGRQLMVGDFVDSQFGTMAGPTQDANDFRCLKDPTAVYSGTTREVLSLSGRLVVAPIVRAHVNAPDDMGTGVAHLKNLPYVHSGQLKVEIIGFAKFLLDPYSTEYGEGVVTGRFVSYVGTPPDGQDPG